MKPKFISLLIILFATCKKGKPALPVTILGKWTRKLITTTYTFYYNDGKDISHKLDTDYDYKVSKTKGYYNYNAEDFTLTGVDESNKTVLVQTLRYKLSGDSLYLYDDRVDSTSTLAYSIILTGTIM